MKYICKSGITPEIKRVFLSLPRLLYSKNELTQEIKTEKQLLTGTHILSTSFEVMPFVVTDKNGTAAARALLTFYPEDYRAYIGFFECINDIEACRLLLQDIELFAKNNEKKHLIGPVNASFWIGYRFKVDKFGSVFTGEPYNKEYYTDFWLKCGFEVTDRYVSSFMRIPTAEDRSHKCERRMERAIKNGYEFHNASFKNFDKNLSEIYSVLINAYAAFPTFKYITEAQFRGLFSSLKYVLNYDMVKLAYKDEQPVGFFISVPNYQNLTSGKITSSKLIKILKIKHHPKEYVMLYMGIDEKHIGLGGALAYETERELLKHKTRGIGALVHKGKISEHYYNMLIKDKSEYVLLGKPLFVELLTAE